MPREILESWELGEHILGLVRDLGPRPDQENDRYSLFHQRPSAAEAGAAPLPAG